jgi:hypothetical protein
MSSSTTLTLTQLIQAVRQRADFVTSQFITDQEFTSYINQSYFELYDLLVQVYGNNYYVALPFLIVTDGQNEFFNLPPDFYKLLGLDLALSNTQDSWVTIRPFNFSDRNRYAVPNFQSFYGVTNMRYRLNANQLWLTPIPAANQTLRLWYVPELVTLVNPTDTVDGISGWTEYIIADVCIKALTKEESDPAIFMAQKNALILRIEAAAENRDAGSPPTVADSQWSDYQWPTGSGSGYGSGSF